MSSSPETPRCRLMKAMTHNAGAPLLSRIGAALEERMGVHFPEERFQDLDRNVRSAARELGHVSVESFTEWLLSTPLNRGQIEMLAPFFTVGETYFFRDSAVYDALGSEVLPRLILSRKQKERRIRIWSAGCSTGEEAYSIAILLDRLLPDLSNWGFTILATDINARCLEVARRGIYHDWSFRNTPQWVKDGYFVKAGKGFQVLPRIRKMVTFSYHNLFDDPYPSVVNNTSAMDIVLCRHVLMYFSRDRALSVIERMHQCILEGGWLVTGPIEASAAMGSRFGGVRFGQATLYRKTHRREGAGQGRTAAKSEPGKKKRHEKSPAGVARHVPMEATAPVAPLKEVVPRETMPLISLAREAADRGRLSEAAELCEKAIDADRLNAPLYYLKAAILMETGGLDEAAKCLRKAIYVDQDFVLAHFSLGHLMHRQERRREARRHFRAVATLLAGYGQDDILPESGGITAARLLEIVKGTMEL